VRQTEDDPNAGPVKDKSYAFALRVIETAKQMRASNCDYVLTRQFVRAGTSIGANVEEAGAAQTKKDFITKMAVASKEARETRYWLRLLTDSGCLRSSDGSRLITQCTELIRLLTAIVKSAQLSTKLPSQVT
jgi:four helix bundle protein